MNRTIRVWIGLAMVLPAVALADYDAELPTAPRFVAAGAASPLPGVYVLGGEGVPLDLLEETKMEAFLTYLNSLNDRDKDGFIEGLGDANPNGYVVFHFRTLLKNERVALGHLLDAPIRAGGPISTGGYLRPAADATPSLENCHIPWEDLDKHWPPKPEPPKRDEKPATVVPEPATLLLMLAAGPMLWRRRGTR